MQGLASPPPPPPPPNNAPPPPSPTHVNRLSETDPLVLAMVLEVKRKCMELKLFLPRSPGGSRKKKKKKVLRCGCKEAKTPSPTGMPHSTSSTDEHLPKTTAASGSGLQHETSAPHSGPSMLKGKRLTAKPKKTTRKKKSGKKVKCEAMQGQKSLPWGEKSTGRRSRHPKVHTSPADDAKYDSTSSGDAWLVGVGKRAPHGFRCLYYSLIMARWLGSKLMHYFPK